MSRSTLFMVRLLAIGTIAAVMALLGVWLLDRDPNVAWTVGGYAYVAWTSVVLWIGLSFLIARSNLTATLAIGLLSPLIGGLAVCPGASHLYLLENWKVTFAIGLVTALLVRLALYLTAGLRSQVVAHPTRCPQCGYDLRGQTQASTTALTEHPPINPHGSRCPECGYFIGAVPSPHA